ncbi:hypothetical protein BJ742DRAFT_249395 [Cladochytrium replicatum]|nr:hypothetical protein BJ742DRAFT_249395 [Cladochytrium replicatum]
MLTGTAFHPSGTIVASCSTDRFEYQPLLLLPFPIQCRVDHPAELHWSNIWRHQKRFLWGQKRRMAHFDQRRIGEGALSRVDPKVRQLTTIILDLKEGTLFYTLHGHKVGPTTAAVFAPDGRRRHICNSWDRCNGYGLNE